MVFSNRVSEEGKVSHSKWQKNTR